jgi:hypothetical protein
MKSSYDQGETIIAKVSGNFYEPLKENNIFFYRGHVKIPMDYDVGKVGDHYYIRASTTGKSPTDYSIKIKNFHYYKAGHLTDEEIVKEFSITEDIADFSIDPAFIISAGGFSIELRNFQSSTLSLDIDTPNGINSLSSIDLSPGQIKEIDFDTSELQETLLGKIEISSSTLAYLIPIYVTYEPPPTGPYCGDGRVDAGEQCDGQDWGIIIDCSDFGFNDGTLSCNPPGTSGECSFDLRNCFTTTIYECDDANPCPSGQVCVDGNCITLEPEQECDTGTTKCEGSIYYICENQEWVNQGKVIDKCDVECLSGDKCVSQEYYICEDDQWENQGLVDGKCGYESEPGECTTEETKCEDTIYYVCENEMWVSQGEVDGECGYSEPPPEEPPEEPEPVCGNRIIEAGEQCDTYRWGEIAGCRSFGFTDGILDCIDCVFDTSSCYNQILPSGCSYNSDCDWGYYCDDGECVPDEVKRCSSVQNCSEGEICFRGLCIEMQECRYNRHCRIGYECEEGTCVKIDYECREDRDCDEDEKCKDNYCVDKEGRECNYDRDCNKGYECDDGYCEEAPECRKDRDCGEGEECDNERCIKVEGDECGPDKRCDPGYKCEEGFCKREKDVECITYRECKDDYTCVKNECVLRSTSKTCDELGGELCTTKEICEGTSREIMDTICCLDTKCTKKPESSIGKILGWSLIIIVALALIYFFFKYKSTRRRKPVLKGTGLTK